MKAILFDLDGTLIDTALDFYHILNDLLQELRLAPVAFEDVRLWAAEGAAVMVKESFNILDEKDPRFSPIKEEFLNRYEQCLGQHAKMFPGVDALLAELDTQGIPWGIVTNKDQRFTERLLRAMHFPNKSRCIISGDSVPERKPHPAPLLAACKKMNVRASDTIYIGDSERDIQAGRHAGMKTIAALYGYIKPTDQPASWQADKSIDAVRDIKAILQDWGYFSASPKLR